MNMYYPYWVINYKASLAILKIEGIKKPPRPGGLILQKFFINLILLKKFLLL